MNFFWSKTIDREANTNLIHTSKHTHNTHTYIYREKGNCKINQNLYLKTKRKKTIYYKMYTECNVNVKKKLLTE